MPLKPLAKESHAHGTSTEVPIIDPFDDDDDYMLDMQEAAELGILNNNRRYVSHRVRKHPYEQ